MTSGLSEKTGKSSRQAKDTAHQNTHQQGKFYLKSEGKPFHDSQKKYDFYMTQLQYIQLLDIHSENIKHPTPQIIAHPCPFLFYSQYLGTETKRSSTNEWIIVMYIYTVEMSTILKKSKMYRKIYGTEQYSIKLGNQVLER